MNMLRRHLTLRLGLGAATVAFNRLTFGHQTSDREDSYKFGVIADLHGGLAVDADERLSSFLTAMKTENCDALMQLGDFAYPNSKHQAFADQLNQAHSDVIHVIGNHEFDFGLKREDCFDAWGIKSAYYARDIGDLQLIVLDGNESGSPDHRGGYPAYLGPEQLAWLDQQLEQSTKPALILSHQPLAGTSAVDNAKQIQTLLSRHRSKILLCLNGHSHVDALLKIAGVSYLHVNSASYYWVGGKTRMAYYSAPLFTTLTIDPEGRTIEVAACSGEWKDVTPEGIGYFERAGAPLREIVVPRIREREIVVEKS